MEKTGRLPKTAIVGADGYLGSRMLKAVRALHPDAIGTSRRKDTRLFPLDVTKLPENLDVWAETGHTHAIITVADANIVRCADDPELAAAVNVTGVLSLVEIMDRVGIVPIFLSSDRVFDGCDWKPGDALLSEESTVNSISVYGQQKIQVEQALSAREDKYLIIRASKIYGTVRGDGTMFDDMAARLTSGKSIDPPYDQFFNPTHVDDFVRAVLALIASGADGFFHVCSMPPCSRWKLGTAMADALSVGSGFVPVPQGGTVMTPMQTEKFRATVGIKMRTPLQGLDEIVSQYSRVQLAAR